MATPPNSSRTVAGIGVLILVACAYVFGQAASPRSVAITDVSVIPMDAPRVVEHQTVVVQNVVITQLGDSRIMRIPPGSQVIRGTRRYLIPGLTDMHVHFQHSAAVNRDFCRLFVVNGLTSVVNLYGTDAHFRPREQVARGRVLGPASSPAALGSASPTAKRRRPLR